MNWLTCQGGESCRCEDCRREVLTITIQGDEYYVAEDFAVFEHEYYELPLAGPQCESCGSFDPHDPDRLPDEPYRLHKGKSGAVGYYWVACTCCGAVYHLHYTPAYHTIF